MISFEAQAFATTTSLSPIHQGILFLFTNHGYHGSRPDRVRGKKRRNSAMPKSYSQLAVFPRIGIVAGADRAVPQGSRVGSFQVALKRPSPQHVNAS